MPKATIDEDGYAFPWKSDVDLSANARENTALHAEPEPTPMQRGAEVHLCPRSSLTSSPHP